MTKHEEDDEVVLPGERSGPTIEEVKAAIERLMKEGRIRIVGCRDGKPVYAAVPRAMH
jgi:hypothetical protein